MGIRMTKYNQYMNETYSPVPTWLFDVKFYSNASEDAIKDTLNSLKCISCSLPESETNTTEVYFFGSVKTIPVKRKFDGEVTMTFFDREGSWDYILNSITKNTAYTDGQETEFFKYRGEFTDTYRFNKVEISVYDISTKLKYRTFYLYNPIITKFNYASELDAGGEDALKYTVTVHYDYWEYKDASKNEDIEEDKEE